MVDVTEAESAQSPASVLGALVLARQGKVYDLETTRWNMMPSHPAAPPFQVLTYRSPAGLAIDERHDAWFGRNDAGFAFTTEYLLHSVHTGTHIDALGHVSCGPERRGHNGFLVSQHVGDFGIGLHDAVSMPPIVSRGILIDMARYLGTDPLPAGRMITRDEIGAALAAQNVSIRPGDTVLVRTGYLSLWPGPDAAKHAGAGLGLDAARDLIEAGAVALGSDTESMEVQPSGDEDDPNPVHILALIDKGVYILEMVNLEELAADGCYEFAFVCLPLKIRGATGSLVRPIAIA